jgi:cell division protein FtsB
MFRRFVLVSVPSVPHVKRRDRDAIHWGEVVRAFWLIPALFAAVLVLAVTDRESGLPMWLDLREELRESDLRITRLQTEVKDLQSEVEALEDDPLAMERAIREVLELARPGETVVRFVEQGGGPTARLK